MARHQRLRSTIGARIKNETMHFRKTEWMLIAVAVGSIACFGNWLQGEMSRASRTRSQPEEQDVRGSCAGMSRRDVQMMDKGALWCGTVDPMRADSLGKA